jgi:uncharacterized protein YbjQ (UPF0145 family)
MATNIKLLTTDSYDKNKYEALGMVSGMQVKSLSILRNLFSGMASFFGTGKKDWTGITKIFEDTKKEAIENMKKNAELINADAIIGVRINISQISHGGRNNDSMLVCSCEGTAVQNITNKTGGNGRKRIKRISKKKNKKSKKRTKNQKKRTKNQKKRTKKIII